MRYTQHTFPCYKMPTEYYLYSFIGLGTSFWTCLDMLDITLWNYFSRSEKNREQPFQAIVAGWVFAVSHQKFVSVCLKRSSQTEGKNTLYILSSDYIGYRYSKW